MKRDELTAYIAHLLHCNEFTDYCPNGLQVEGKDNIQRVVCGVTACQALLDAAVAERADAVIVHHGYFWKGEAPSVCGMKKQRLATLLKNDINLLAYHLPLDAHPQLGNNAQLAKQAGWTIISQFAPQNIACLGQCQEQSLAQLATQLSQMLGREPTVIGSGTQTVRRVAWCTGAAQDYLQDAAQLHADVFISGEISERTTHEARELGISYLAIGHHASEKGGIRALGEHLNQLGQGLDCQFIDIANPA